MLNMGHRNHAFAFSRQSSLSILDKILYGFINYTASRNTVLVTQGWEGICPIVLCTSWLPSFFATKGGKDGSGQTFCHFKNF